MIRRIRFRLATLLAVMMVCCVIFAWFGFSLRTSERLLAQRKLAVTRFAAMNGRIMGWGDSGPSHVIFQGTNFDDAVLKQLKKALTDSPDIVHVLLFNTNGTDAALAELSKLNHLQELQLKGSTITDEGLRHIGAMQELRQLSLADGQYTDAGIRHLENMKQLTWMNIRTPNVSTAGTARLKDKLPKVRFAAEPAGDRN